MTFNFTVKEFILGGGTGIPTLQFYGKGFNIGLQEGSQPTWQDVILKGTTALTLTNAKTNSLEYLKLFGGCTQTALPQGYTQLDSITLDGNCYFDTGIVIKSLDSIVTFIASFDTSLATTSPRMMWGYMGSTGSLPRWGVGGYSSKWLTTPNATNSQGTIDGNRHTFITSIYDNDGTAYYKTLLDGESLVNASLISPQVFTDNILSAYIGARNNSGTASNFSICNFTYLEIVQDGICDGRIYPCKRNSDNTLGLYNTVTNEFLTNQGSGTLTAGSTTLSPSPDNPMDIVCNNGTIKYSANMANVNAQTALIGYYISSSGVVTADAGNWIYQDYIPVEPSTTYTLTISTPVYYVTISEYSTTDDSGFVRRNAGSTGSNTTLTITTRSNTKYIRFGTNIRQQEITLQDVLAINWMLNVGNTMAYQPYVKGGIYTDGTVETVEVDTTGDTATAEMLLSLLVKGGDSIYAQDTQNVTTGEVTRNVGIKVFDGTETWNRGSNQDASGNYVFYMSLTDRKIQDSAQGLLCSHFKFRGTVSYSTILQDEFCINQTIQYIYFDGGTRTTIDEWKAYLASQYANGTPIIVVYPLAEPTTETVTAQHLNIKAGTNVVEITQASIDNLELEVSYKAKAEGE